MRMTDIEKLRAKLTFTNGLEKFTYVKELEKQVVDLMDIVEQIDRS
jgi:hypothetical protein